MSGSTSGSTIEIETGGTIEVVDDLGSGDVELFPEDRPEGPMSGVFRSAQRFRELLHSEE